MKYILLLLILTTQLTNASAQLNKATWLIGGNGSLYSYNENYTAPSINVTAKYTNIDISANIGYFFADKFAGGLRPYFLSEKGESSGGGRTNNLKFTVGPFARYYFLASDKQFNIFSDACYQFGTNMNKGGGDDDGKFNVFSAMTGVEAFFNSAVGIELAIGYSKKITTLGNSGGILKSDKNGFQASIGFQFHLTKD